MTDSDVPEEKSPEEDRPPLEEESLAVDGGSEDARDSSAETGREGDQPAENGWSLDEVTLGALEDSFSEDLGEVTVSADDAAVSEDGSATAPEELDALIAALTSEPGAADEQAESESIEALADKILSDEPLVEKSLDETLPPLPETTPDIQMEGVNAKADAEIETALSGTELDALLVKGDEGPLDGREPDAVLGNEPTEAIETGAMGQSEIDSLITSLGQVEEAVPRGEEPPPEAPDKDSNLVSQDLIDEIVSAAQGGDEEVKEEVSDADIEAIIRQAQGADATPEEPAQEEVVSISTMPPEEEAPPEVVPEVAPGTPPESAVVVPDIAEPKQRKRRRVPLPIAAFGAVRARFGEFFHENYLKVGVTTATMVVFTLGTFTLLYTHQSRPPTDADLVRLRGSDLGQAMAAARELMAEGAYAAAAQLLKDPIGAARPSAERTDARYLRVEALVKALPKSFTEEEGESVHAEIDDVLDSAPSNPRAPEALRWKAELYRRAGLPRAAREMYTRLLNEYPKASGLDDVLMDLARVCVDIDQRKEAAACVQRLLHQYPGSPRVGEARLWLADAFAATGNPSDARTLYVRIAQAYPGTPLSAEAIARLGELAYGEGDYREAVNQLEAYLKRATTVEGHDRVYLVLAKSYRALGRLDEAHRVLNELIRFFPESDVTPRALIELSQVLDEMGSRKDALKTASRAARTYSDNPAVLENAGSLYNLAGQTAQAARYWLDAHHAGSEKPTVLLASARAFRTIGDLHEAAETYRLLQAVFPGTPEAIEGGIEHAQVLCEAGLVREALERIEVLASATEGRPQQLPVLAAMGDLYARVGLSERAIDAFRQVASLGTEPEVLAHVAASLLKAGAINDGLAVANRVDVARVRDETAYGLLMAQGAALRRVDPRQALDKMQQAYDGYPDQRTAEGEQQLLEGYLALDNTARARALVMNIESRVRRQPVDGPRLERAALAWGDYLYARGDYRAAADAFDMALEWGASNSRDAWWTKLQRANALFRLSDIDGAVALFDEVAAADTPWADQAALMGDYARLEQRLRGLDVTPKPSQAG